MRLPDLAKQMALRTSAIFLVKIMGFFSRIFLFRLLGPEGVGLYQMAYSVYALILTGLTGGFPTALALVTASNHRQGLQLFKGTIIFFALSGIVLGYYVYLLAPRISVLLGNTQLEFALQCIAPAIAIVPFLTLLRGFLQGVEYYGYIAVSEIMEQLVRISVMIVIAIAWLKFGTPYTVGGLMLGAPAGALVSLFFLLIILVISAIHKLNINTDSTVHLARHGILIYILSSLFILATRLIVPASDFLDALIIPHRLQAAGFNSTEATSVYGIITGMATMVVYIPTIVSFAMSYTLSTKITADWQAGRKDRFVRQTGSAMEMIWLWGCGSALVLFFYAGELSNLIFSNASAEPGIRYMALAPLLSGIRELSTVALWATGDKKTPLIGLIIGSVCSLILNYFLIAIPGFTYAGAAIGILSLEMIAALWNMNALRTCTQGIRKGLFIGTMVIILLFALSLSLVKLTSQAFHLSIHVQSIGEMTIIYSIMSLYILMRFLKNERRIIV